MRSALGGELLDWDAVRVFVEAEWELDEVEEIRREPGIAHPGR